MGHAQVYGTWWDAFWDNWNTSMQSILFYFWKIAEMREGPGWPERVNITSVYRKKENTEKYSPGSLISVPGKKYGTGLDVRSFHKQERQEGNWKKYEFTKGKWYWTNLTVFSDKIHNSFGNEGVQWTSLLFIFCKVFDMIPLNILL